MMVGHRTNHDEGNDMTTTTPAAERNAIANDIANEITRQATSGVLMSLGAHNREVLSRTENRRGGAAWTVLVLPFRKNGTRGTKARRMRLAIQLTHADDYTIQVSYMNRGDLVTHYYAEGVYCDQLAPILLALDYDGDTVLNPRVL